MKVDKKTLLLFTPGFPENESDSTCVPPQQIFVRSLLEQYPQFNIVVLSFQYPLYKNVYKWMGADVISFGGRDRGGISRFLLWQKVRKKVRELVSKELPAGILSFWCGECALLGHRLAKKYNIPHFTWILGQDAKRENKYIKWIRPAAGELVALSDFLQTEFEKNHGIRPQHVIPPGIDSRLFGKHDPQRDIDVLAVGSLIPLKQYPVFIEVIRELKKQVPFIKAVLIGKGPEKEKLQALINEWQLQDAITITGELSHAVTLSYMQRAKVFLHPSLYEGFGVVNIEALYAGASVISFTQPMKIAIPNWYIVNSKEAMVTKGLELLYAHKPHVPVMVYPIEKSVKKMMQLFEPFD